MPRFLQFLEGLLPINKDPNVLVTDLHFGTIPVRLLKPKKASSQPRRGIIFYHGGGALTGSLGEELAFEGRGKVFIKGGIRHMVS